MTKQELFALCGTPVKVKYDFNGEIQYWPMENYHPAKSKYDNVTDIITNGYHDFIADVFAKHILEVIPL